MQTLIPLFAGGALTLNFLAALIGGWCWWSVKTSRLFWLLVRTAQVGVGILAAGVGMAVLFFSYRPHVGLFWVYALLPVVVSFFAEQLRVLAAQTVLEDRGYGNIDAFREAPPDEQQSVALAIARREIGGNDACCLRDKSAFVTCYLL